MVKWEIRSEDKLKKTVKYLLLPLIILSNLFWGGHVFATSDYGTQFVTNTQIKDEQGKAVEEHHVFGYYDTFMITYDWAIPDNQTLSAGDTMTLKLPSGIQFPGNIQFEVRSPKNDLVGMAIVNKALGTVKVTFTDFVEQHQNIKGSLDLWVQWDKSKVQENSETPINLGINGTIVLTVGDQGTIDPNETLTKWGWVDEQDPLLIHWVVRINYAKSLIKNAEYIDYIGAGQSLVADSISVSLGHYGQNNSGFVSESELSKEHLTIGDELKTFKVTFGDLDKSAIVEYSTRVVKELSSKAYDNSGTLTGINIKEDKTHSFVQDFGGDGNADGKNKETTTTTSSENTTDTTNTTTSSENTTDTTNTTISSENTTDTTNTTTSSENTTDTTNTTTSSENTTEPINTTETFGSTSSDQKAASQTSKEIASSNLTSSSSTKRQLPKTGEKKENGFWILGMFILLLGMKKMYQSSK